MPGQSLDYYEVTVPPADLPVTVAEFLEFAKLGTPTAAEEAMITGFLTAATDDLERYTNRWFVERTAIGYYPNLSLTQYEKAPFAEIQHAPLLDVSEVATWVDDDFAAYTDYKLKERDGYARVLFPNWANISSLCYNDEPYQIRITFDAGYGDADAVPALIKTAILMYATYLYENRGDCDCGADARQASGAKALVARYKILRTF